MPRRLATGRVVGAVLAAGLLTATVHFGLQSRRFDRDFQSWIDARLATLSVDLSKPGTYTTKLEQTCQTSHGEGLVVDVPGELTDQKVVDLFDGVQGVVTIADASGREVVREKFLVRDFQSVPNESPLVLAGLPAFPIGQYTLTLDVTKGAPALAGIQQAVYVKYFLCGLERMPATIAGVFAFLCGAATVFVLMFAGTAIWQDGWYADDKTDGNSSP